MQSAPTGKTLILSVGALCKGDSFGCGSKTTSRMQSAPTEHEKKAVGYLWEPFVRAIGLSTLENKDIADAIRSHRT
jgi:hypothetical protein